MPTPPAFPPPRIPPLDEQQYPAVGRAYDFVLPSYQWVVSRFESADTRLTAVLTLASTLTLGAPVIGKSVREDISFTAPLFITAMVLFIAAAVVGLIGRLYGRLSLPDPALLYSETLHESEWEFRKNALYFAGVHFARNAKTIRVKGYMAVAVTVGLFLEVLVLIGWMAFESRRPPATDDLLVLLVSHRPASTAPAPAVAIQAPRPAIPVHE